MCPVLLVQVHMAQRPGAEKLALWEVTGEAVGIVDYWQLSQKGFEEVTEELADESSVPGIIAGQFVAELLLNFRLQMAVFRCN
jgi:hypothetical protein